MKRQMKFWSILLTLSMVILVALPVRAQELPQEKQQITSEEGTQEPETGEGSEEATGSTGAAGSSDVSEETETGGAGESADTTIPTEEPGTVPGDEQTSDGSESGNTVDPENSESDNDETEDTEESTEPLKLSYQAHVQTYGWQKWVDSGQQAGTTDQAKRLEAIAIKIEDMLLETETDSESEAEISADEEGGIRYRVHGQTYGWQGWKENGEIAGTTGQAKRVEAIQIRLTGTYAEKYDIYYRVHCQTYGWLDWAKGGDSDDTTQKAGTSAYAKRLEAIEIRLVEKGAAAPGPAENCYYAPQMKYQSHVQTYGWQSQKFDGQLSGTTNQYKRLEGIKISLHDPEYSGGIQYRSHIQSYGWETNWKSDGQLSGTTGQKKRLEAIQIQLTGEMAEHYDVYYRVHCQTKGWMPWTCNGNIAGTEGFAKRLEAIEIKLEPKDPAAPAVPGQAYLRKYKDSEISFFGHVRENEEDVTAGNNGVLGTTGQKKHLEGFGANLDQSSGEVPTGTIQYRAHCQTYGWMDWVNQGGYAGTRDEDKRMEAIQIRLTGELSKYYDVYYRAHVQTYGWLGWTKNGGTAGTTGISYRIEAIQIYLLPKNEKGPATSASSYKTVVNLPSQSGSALSSFGSYTMSAGVRNRLNSAISNFTKIGRRVGFYVVDLSNGKGIYYNSNNSFYSASTIKGPYVVSLNENVPGSATASGGLMRSAIKVSDNSAYLALRRTYGSGPFTSWVAAAGCSGVNTSRNYTDLTPRQLAQMWAKSYEYFYSGKPNSTFCRDLFTGTLNSPISNTLRSKCTVYSKAGWIGEGGYYNVQNDGGIVMRSGHPYVVVILSTAYGRLDYMNTLVSAIDAAHEEMIR